jgi:CubicO group peptidase (beta-lactamase class C family)
MILRRILIVVALVLLVGGSSVIGVLVADWPFWKRVIAVVQLPDSGEWPESFYQPVARIEGKPRGFFPAAAPGEESIAPQALAAAASWAEQNETVALLVMHRGVVQLERYWQGMTADQLFSGRAMSRSLLGLVYGFAVAEGRIALDDPVEKYLPEWRGEPRGQIRVRQLMQNVSGLEEVPLNVVNAPPDAAGPVRAWYLLKSFLGKNSRLSLASDFAAVALSFDLAHEPGTRFAFSNANSQLLGVILERATGEPFERYVEQRLWRQVAADAGEFYMDRSGGMPAVYCCFRATPRDFLRVGALLADDGRSGEAAVLPAGWIAQLRGTSSVNPVYGLQLWSGNPRAGVREYATGSGRGVTHGEPYVTDDVLWLEGGGGRTIWVVPSEDLVIVRLGRASPTWDAAVLPNTLLRGLRPAQLGAAQ